MRTLERRAVDGLLSGFGPFDTMPIAGTWRPGAGGSELQDRDPWTGAVLTELRQASAADVEAAYETAVAAQRGWAARLPAERAEVMLRAARILEQRHAEIAAWVIAESGGTVGKVEVELAVTRAIFLEAAGLVHHMDGRITPSDIPGKENRVYRRPVGVVCLISPWDFPMYLTSRSLAPALALGNAVVLKPSSQTPVTGGLLLARILQEAGLPEGVLSVVVGPSRDIGDTLVAHPAARVLSFTGSTETGLAISRTAGLKRLLLELGGNAPLVVLDDADVDYAVESAVFGSFFNSGQICMIANRIIVDHTLHDQFVEAFVGRVRQLTVGDPADPSTFIGPVISADQLDLGAGQDRSIAGTRSRAAAGRRTRAVPPVCSFHRTSCWAATTPPPLMRRSSAQRSPSCALETTSTPSSWPTTPSTASPRPSTPATTAAVWPSRCASRPG